MILTNTGIRQAVEAGGIGIDPFAARQVQPASYDLRVGSQGIATMLDSLRSLSRNVGELTENVNRFTAQNEIIQRQNRYTLWVVGLGLAFVALLVALK